MTDYKTVPVEPTEEMLRDGWNAYLGDMKGGFDRFAIVYRAMLSAAPTPPAQTQAEFDADTYDWCGCGDGYPKESHDAGFMAAAGHCQNCDAAERTATPQAEAQAGETDIFSPHNACMYRDYCRSLASAPQSQDAERYRLIRTALHPEDVRHILDEMRFFGEWSALEVDAVIDAVLQAKEQQR